MKKTIMNLMTVVFPGALVLACSSGGGTGPDGTTQTAGEALCAKGAMCMLLNTGVTEQKCSQDSDQFIAKLRALPECATVADANEASFECAGALSCEEMKAFLADDQGTHKCNQPISSLSLGTLQSCNAAQSPQSPH